ncbi:MAG: hypothetical protein ABW185_03155, partial [Sedimenticola sp.]
LLSQQQQVLDNPQNGQQRVNSVIQPSWNDPQIHISTAAGKSTGEHLDICDFVSGSIEEEVVIGGQGDQHIVVKSGPRRPKLDTLTLCQWSVANLSILYRLVGDNKLPGPALMDYLSYTTKIYQLVQKYSLISVFLYDREYRKLQANMNFRWGTDVQHLHTLMLQSRDRPVNQSSQGVRKGGALPSGSKGKGEKSGNICRSFNDSKGCTFPSCRYKHQCSVQGCGQRHSAIQHSVEKN